MKKSWEELMRDYERDVCKALIQNLYNDKLITTQEYQNMFGMIDLIRAGKIHIPQNQIDEKSKSFDLFTKDDI